MFLIFDQVIRSGEVVEIPPGGLVIGRDEGADLTLDDDQLSRRHARIAVAQNGAVVLDDLRSTNGTFVDGARVQAAVTLRGGERIEVGSTSLVYSVTRSLPDQNRTVLVTAGAPAVAPAAIAPGPTSLPAGIDALRPPPPPRQTSTVKAVAVAVAVVAFDVALFAVTRAR